VSMNCCNLVSRRAHAPLVRGVLILALCALALSACGSGGNGGGEAGGNATGEGSSAPVEFEYENKVEHWDVALPDRSRDSFDEVT
ncbi:hypothetical protein OSL57_26690, partial [Escherichia coli]|nr:hypothetical protein [Escherichia coli]